MRRPTIVWRGERYDQAYQPAWSPDGTRIAFSAWRHGGYRDILVVERRDRARSRRSRAIARSTCRRAWSRRRALALLRQRSHRHLEHLRVRHRGPRRCGRSRTCSAARSSRSRRPTASGSRSSAAVPEGGYDLFELALDRATWLPARDYVDDRPPPVDVRDDEAAGQRAAAVPPARDARAAGVDGLSSSSAIAPSATHPDRRRRRVRPPLATRSRSARTSTTATSTSARRTATAGWRQTLRLAAARTIVERGGFRIDGVNKRVPRGGLERDGVVEHPVRVAARRELDAVVRLRRRLVPRSSTSRCSCSIRTMRVPVRAADRLRAGGHRHAARRSRRVRGTIYGLGSQCGFDAAVGAAARSPGARRDLSQRHGQLLDEHVPAAVGQDAGARDAARRRAARRRSRAHRRRSGSAACPPQDVAMAIVNSTRAGRHRLPARLSGAHGRRQPVPPAEPRVPPGAARRSSAASRRCRSTSGASTSALLVDVGTAFDTTFDADRAPAASVGAALRVDAFFGYFVPGHVRARLRARPDRGRHQRDLVPAHGEPVSSRTEVAGERRDRDRAPARRAGARAARSPRPRRRSPRAPRRDLDRADAVSVALAADAAPGPRRRLPRGDARSRAGSTSSIARSTTSRRAGSISPTAVDLGLRLAGHHLERRASSC